MLGFLIELSSQIHVLSLSQNVNKRGGIVFKKSGQNLESVYYFGCRSVINVLVWIILTILPKTSWVVTPYDRWLFFFLIREICLNWKLWTQDTLMPEGWTPAGRMGNCAWIYSCQLTTHKHAKETTLKLKLISSWKPCVSLNKGWRKGTNFKTLIGAFLD